MQKIISWNVASVRARLPVLLDLLDREKPDIVFLQEIKATEDTFPFFDFQLAGYTAIISGQKSYNGVAILSKKPLKNPVYTLTGFEDQARFIQAEDDQGRTCICVYVPNGNPPEKNPNDTTKLMYKLNWMTALTEHIKSLIRDKKSVILGGDFNVIEQETDVYNPDHFRDSALMVPPVQKCYQSLLNIPLTNILRNYNPEPHTYTFWDFQGGAWIKNHGILLDAFLITPDLTNQIKQAHIHKEIRALKGTSDHAPVSLILEN